MKWSLSLCHLMSLDLLLRLRSEMVYKSGYCLRDKFLYFNQEKENFA